MTRAFLPRRAFALAISMGALLGTGGAAVAATRITPPLFVSSGGSMLCTATNLSTAPRTVTIEVRDSAGNLVPFANANCSATNPKTSVVDPGAVTAIGCAGSGYRYCRFTINGAGKTSLRGVLRVFDGASATLGVLPAK